ncbi:MAG: hypothetical protein A2041_04120 [Bacteroidetes bacterium GWA2_31_9b]|nr:MAG: hypothetical protein A2041_04120 [Bacteroidetes bacterium GWA2_31_9b]
MKHKLLIILLALNLIPFIGFSQIRSDADFIDKTSYISTDSIHVFCTSNINGGSLIAEDSTSLGGYDFIWYKFNDITKDFTEVISGFTINIDSTSSTILNLTSGGYKVVLTNADTIQEYVAWIYLNNELTVELSFDNDNDCNYLGLYVNPYYATSHDFNTSFVYYDTISDLSFVLKNRISLYEWSSDPEFEYLRNYNSPFNSMNESLTDDLPTEDLVFAVTATDRFSCIAHDDINYTAIATKADLKMTVFDRDGIEISSGDTTVSGEAPLIVKFTNESKHGYEFMWFFGDSLIKNDEDSIFTTDFNLQPEHTYYYTEKSLGKKYTAKLVSESEYGCKDSILAFINVDPSKFEIPNVFSPNDDGNNDFFIIDPEKFKSIRSFKITIFNRNGQIVHEFEGDIHDWKGWNGSVKGKGEASEGTYFFVLEVVGWDAVKYNNDTMGKETKFGFIGLFR